MTFENFTLKTSYCSLIFSYHTSMFYFSDTFLSQSLFRSVCGVLIMTHSRWVAILNNYRMFLNIKNRSHEKTGHFELVLRTKQRFHTFSNVSCCFTLHHYFYHHYLFYCHRMSTFGVSPLPWTYSPVRLVLKTT